MDQDRYYRPSGAVPFVGTLLMLLCGGAAAVILSFVYGLLTAYNPFVYVTFIGTVLFGLGMGAAVVFGALAGNVRNHVFTAIVAACVGLVGLYLTWVFFIPYVLRQMGLKGVPFQFDPEYLFGIIGLFGDNGVWTIFGWTPKGWALYAFWLIEAAIILGATLVVALAQRNPFCEACRRWTDEEKPVRPLALADPDRLRTALENERYDLLDELCDAEIAPENSLRVTLHHCPQCGESNFLTVSHVRLTTDREGNVQTQSADLVRRIRVPDTLVEHLRVALNEPDAPAATPADEPGSAVDGDLDADPTEHDAASVEPPR